MTKSGIARIVILILFFFFMILYGMQLTGYNDYRTNRKKMLTSEELSNYEKDIKEGKDVSRNDYLTRNKSSYNNRLSNLGLDISKGIISTLVFNSFCNFSNLVLRRATKIKS